MNRKERRVLAKRLHTTPNVIEAALALLKLGEIKAKKLETGDKVRIDVDRIKTRKIPFRQNYLDFVEAHRQDVFTVEQDTTPYTYIVTLAEDTTQPKWYFHADDLIKVEE